jgi:hypothetical protein
MEEIAAGMLVFVRDVSGKALESRALSAIVPGRDFPVVWACREDEWLTAHAEDRQPEGVPWPAEDVTLEIAGLGLGEGAEDGV